MNRMLFVDHSFHKKTKSFDFLKILLSSKFDIEHLYVDPASPIDYKLIETDADYILVAQLDYLTPLFIAQNKRVIVVQMYDGSASLPDNHWKLNRQAVYINFSQSLHIKAVANGCRSLLVKFAPDAQSFRQQTDFSELKAFFWNRLPQSPINTKTIGRLLHGQLKSMHVHLPRDDGLNADHNVAVDFDCEVTTSIWFEDRADYARKLDDCNVFVAPRQAEGIGHAFLEAMARGMIVIAWDLPTHSEYISNWSNGVLFDGSVTTINLKNKSNLDQIGNNARYSIEMDFLKWMPDQEKIVDFILQAKPSVVPDIPRIRKDIEKVIEAYSSGLHYYIQTLDNIGLTLDIMSQWKTYTESAEKEGAILFESSLFHTFELGFGVGNIECFDKRGFNTGEEHFSWTSDIVSQVIVPSELIRTAGGVVFMEIECRSVHRNSVHIEISGMSVAKLDLNAKFERFTFSAPEHLFNKKEIIIIFSTQKLFRPKNGDDRSLGVAIKYLRFGVGVFESEPTSSRNDLRPQKSSVVSGIQRIFNKAHGSLDSK